jgi:hypothetical protein
MLVLLLRFLVDKKTHTTKKRVYTHNRQEHNRDILQLLYNITYKKIFINKNRNIKVLI